MPEKIYLIQPDDELQPMTEQDYSSEDLLQTLLEKYPDLLAGEQMNAEKPRRWLLISREFAVPDEEDGGGRWSLDHLFLDQDAIPTLVEVKRSSDTRIRREVVGQMLDYAANAVVYWPVEAIIAKYEAACDEQGLDPDEQIAELLDADPEEGGAVENFWQQVKTNLQAGRIRMVFVADEIPQELKRIVEFLNEQTDPAEVLAVEIKQFVGGDVRTLVPRVIGQTAEAQKRARATGKRIRWDETTFFKRVESTLPDTLTDVIRDLYKWSQAKADLIQFGIGTQTGAFTFRYIDDQIKLSVFSIFTDGSLLIRFNHYNAVLNEEIVTGFRSDISQLPAFSDFSNLKKILQGVMLNDAFVDNPKQLTQFKRRIEGFLEELASL